MKDEQICQINVINWLRNKYPEIEKLTYHFANERKCSIVQGRLLKRMGVKRGISDLFISVPRQNRNGLWLEIKVKNGKLSEEQKEFLESQVKNNFAAACCWDLEAVISVVSNYLSNNDFSMQFESVIYKKTV